MTASYDYQVAQTQILDGTVLQLMLVPLNGIMVHEAGQYLHLSLPGFEPRPFSIANAPRPDGHLELHIRYHSYAQALLAHVKTTGQVTVQGPAGNCRWVVSDQPVILIAQGTGLAPIKACIEQARSHPPPAVSLFWGAQNIGSRYMQSWLKLWRDIPAWQDHPLARSMASDVAMSWAQQVLAIHSDLSKHRVYAAGDFHLIRTLFEHLWQAGLPVSQAHADALSA